MSKSCDAIRHCSKSGDDCHVEKHDFRLYPSPAAPVCNANRPHRDPRVKTHHPGSKHSVVEQAMRVRRVTPEQVRFPAAALAAAPEPGFPDRRRHRPEKMLHCVMPGNTIPAGSILSLPLSIPLPAPDPLVQSE